MIFSHDGDFGDTIAALSVMKSMGGGDLVLFPSNTRERMSPARAAVITPLLEAQHYVGSIRYADRPAEEGLNLGHWRHNYKSGLNLCDMYYHWIGKPHPHRYQPWLSVEPNATAPVVLARSPRYHGSFPWKRAVKKYRDNCVFLGLPQEHRDFCARFGRVPFVSTENLLQAARIIQGAKLVCVNQTALFWIAEALKRPVCLEVSGDGSLRNCHWERAGFFYGTSAFAELPDLDALDDCVASVCASRDLGRSLLTEDRRERLAQLAVACASLPGDMAEVGVFRGGSAAILAAACPDKSVHLFDTFVGHPADDDFAEGHKQREFAADLEDVKRFLAGGRAVFHPGVFPATTAGLEETRFCLVHLDGDLYQTTRDALAFFWPRLVEGGVIVLDDWRWQACPGVEQAVAEAGLADRVTTTATNQAEIRR